MKEDAQLTSVVPIEVRSEFNGRPPPPWISKSDSRAKGVAWGEIVCPFPASSNGKLQLSYDGKTSNSPLLTFILPVQILFKTSGTIINDPEYVGYKYAVVYGQGENLGPLPMGRGRAEHPSSYTAPLMAMAKVPTLPGISFHWVRLVTLRSWFFQFDQNGKCQVLFRTALKGPTPDINTMEVVQNTPSPQTGNIYIWDNPATDPSYQHPPVGVYIYEKKNFYYAVYDNIATRLLPRCCRKARSSVGSPGQRSLQAIIKASKTSCRLEKLA